MINENHKMKKNQGKEKCALPCNSNTVSRTRTLWKQLFFDIKDKLSSPLINDISWSILLPKIKEESGSLSRFLWLEEMYSDVIEH